MIETSLFTSLFKRLKNIRREYLCIVKIVGKKSEKMHFVHIVELLRLRQNKLNQLLISSSILHLTTNQQQYTAPNQQYVAPVDNGGFGWGLLGCCIPLVGLILFLVWKNEKPKTAKAVGMGALISVICSILFYFFSAVLGLGIGLIGL